MKELDEDVINREEQLASLCTRGDESALKELYTKYATRIIVLCSRYVHDEESAKDLMHDTMLKAFVSIGRFRYKGEGSLYAWLRGIAIKTAVDKYRSQRLENSPLLFDLVDDSSWPVRDEIRAVPMKVLREMISTLPSTQKIIFNMFCLDGCSHKEIANYLGITEKASSSLLSKAKKTLGRRIKKYLER